MNKYDFSPLLTLGLFIICPDVLKQYLNKYQQDIYDISMNDIITESKCGTNHIWHLCGIPLVGRSCAL
ncbi:hypothetical protein V1477_019703 [Vespula maculifrons]|uniref:Uncharacterized protein n=1 Tax=Vespula maculifrons TaxID=7453 RepID=A0ABD2AS09_VESMC